MNTQVVIIGLMFSLAWMSIDAQTCANSMMQTKSKIQRNLASSDNGKNYECNTTALAEANKCIFIAAGDALTSGTVMVKSVVDRTVGDVNGRKVVDATGAQLRLGMRPWENEVGEAAATAGSVTDAEWMYLLSYELLVPLRNAMMFEPDTVTGDVAHWHALTKVFNDCHIKQTTTEYSPFDKYSVADIYEILKDPNSYYSGKGPSLSNPILQFLEEGSADLWCAMTGVNIDDDHCLQVWADNGVEEGTISNCWEAAYDGLYGPGAAAAALTPPTVAPAPAAPTPATVAPAPVAPTPATVAPAPTPATVAPAPAAPERPGKGKGKR